MLKKKFEGCRGIVLLGVPGCFKTSYARELEKSRGYFRLSLGELFFKNKQKMNKETNVDSFESQLASLEHSAPVDQLALFDLAYDALEKAKKEQQNLKIVIDGTPKTDTQLRIFEQLFDISILKVVTLSLPLEVSVRLLLNREICPSCLKTYNSFFLKDQKFDIEALLPKVTQTCDNCSTILTKRPQDLKGEILKRLTFLQSNQVQVLKGFESRGVKTFTFQPFKGIKDFDRFVNEFDN